jgi:hypothetical protein
MKVLHSSSSVTVIVKVAVSAVNGIPFKKKIVSEVPVVKDNPLGREPVVTLIVYGEIPPLTVRVALNSLPTTASSKEFGARVIKGHPKEEKTRSTERKRKE